VVQPNERGGEKLINAERRGVIAGSEEVKNHAKPAILEEPEINRIANQVFDYMQQRGYAHIEPREDFIRGFNLGFKFNQA
jgi:hypothetical protein